MPSLVATMKQSFSEVLTKYSDSQPTIKKFLQDWPVIDFVQKTFLGAPVSKEVDLADAKRTESRNLIERLFSPGIISKFSELEIIRETAGSDESNLTEESAFSLRKPLKGRLLASSATRRNSLDDLARHVQDKIIKIKEIRDGHKEGHLDAILEAMRVCVNFLIIFYNRRAASLQELVNIDNIDEENDPILQWFAFIAHYLAASAYDHGLVQHYEKCTWLSMDEQYFLGSGVDKLNPEVRKQTFRALYIYLGELGARYRTWLQLIQAKAEIPATVFLEVKLIIDLIQLEVIKNPFLGSKFLDMFRDVNSLQLTMPHHDGNDTILAAEKVHADVAMAQTVQPCPWALMVQVDSAPASDDEIANLPRPINHLISGEMRHTISTDTEQQTLDGLDSGRSSVQAGDSREEELHTAIRNVLTPTSEGAENVGEVVAQNVLFSVPKTTLEEAEAYLQQQKDALAPPETNIVADTVAEELPDKHKAVIALLCNHA